MVSPARPQFEGTKVYEGEEAVRRLADLGLRADYFLAAMQRGHELQARCTPVHPLTYAGQVMWAETVAELRTQLLDVNQGWDKGHTNNYETTYHRERALAIAVLGGDGNTGVKAFSHPRLARKRGPVTAQRVARNQYEQIPIDLPGLSLVPKNDELCLTWFFLIRARRKSLMNSELSLPLSLGADQRVELWAERILLPAMPLVGAITPTEPDYDLEKPVVHVGRK